jgi:hypothetical protein
MMGQIGRLVPWVGVAVMLTPTLCDPKERSVPDALRQKAYDEGAVRVIVQLRVSALPEGELGSAEAVAAQRRAIVSAQSAVLSALAGTGYRVIRTFETIPFLALDVSPGALEALEGSALVVGVEEDRVAAPQRTPNRPAEDNDRAPADESSRIPR